MIKDRINAAYNCKNPFQGKQKRVLCVCSAGLLRSPTLAVVLQKEFNYNTRSCGIHDYALIEIDSVLCYWADEIVVVNKNLQHKLLDEYKDKVIYLNIEDQYEYMNPELQKECLKQYKEAT